MLIRPPAAAGRFFPSDPERLRTVVKALIDGAGPAGAETPKALIAPHAGYAFSGAVAALAMATLRAGRGRIRRVVLLGTAHSRVLGLATTRAEGFETPIGVVPVDRGAIEAVADLPQVSVDDRAHRVDHALEVELPMLQVVLDRFEIAPFLVGRCTPGEVAEVIDRLWGGEETVIVVSSDLSHFHQADEASRIDRQTADAIEALEPDRLAEGSACGRRAIAGLLIAARGRGLGVKTLALRNSGESGGPPDRVVGYGAFAIGPSGAS
ncbi:AmmeMemoRadiSam system protein B [Tautonia plasticadhaerens]|uniref:MEMO1 family protein n=1 Tax=Tautonia plasticadhaerens TaxID=2527974 RepID=A0A518HAI7_9BACT|nr:AmmeMemoRadiSam system protein B [Tautonia plasticadhaerens]QDV37868.1 hypothetical protein ElP_58150 [Tautonia plasticadhaerens]